MERPSRINKELFALLDVFVAAVECGSFSSAADRLHLTRSAVGKSVARLEDRLGTRLLHRNTRRSSLTEQGHVFYEHAARALAEIQAAADMLDQAQHQPRGRVRVTMPVVFGRRCVTPALTALAREHPHLDLELSLTDRVVDVIEENVDVALRIGTFAPTGDMAGRALGGHWMLVCGSADYLSRFGHPATLQDLASHQCITYARDGRLRPWEFMGEDGRIVEVPVRSRMRVDDLEVERDAALEGHGLARLPSWLIADDLKQGRLEIALSEARPFVHEMHAVWPHRRPLPLRIRVVVDAVLDAVRPVLLPSDPGAPQIPVPGRKKTSPSAN